MPKQMTFASLAHATKKKAGKRDPDMSSTKKGNDWYFGPPLVVCKQTTGGQWKAHVGVDADSGIVHSLDTTTAKMHDSRVWADEAYINAKRADVFAGPASFWVSCARHPKAASCTRTTTT